MRYHILFLALSTLVALCPVYAQGSSTPNSSSAETADVKTGVRFVICSPGTTANRLPSPLYYQIAKDKYGSVSISSRIPTPRIKPDATNKVTFYDQDPTPPDPKNKEKGKPAEMPKPVMVINVPSNAGSKSLCLVVPGETPAKAKTLFLNEADFPKKGVHVINLSSTPLKISTSKKGDYSDAKVNAIAPYNSADGISKANSWKFSEGKHGDQVSFQLTYQKQGSPNATNLKRSKFVVSERQSQINLVVKDPASKNLRLLSIQLTD